MASVALYRLKIKGLFNISKQSNLSMTQYFAILCCKKKSRMKSQDSLVASGSMKILELKCSRLPAYEIQVPSQCKVHAAAFVEAIKGPLHTTVKGNLSVIQKQRSEI
ncbi:hypothetical protein VNO77_43076 [Canavalia gladiata]|uniref:Uncharacterized protein n=1 Tax=Canavalia gladiata TaxID=3824 RepID=A0AAN9JW68_CANGL